MFLEGDVFWGVMERDLTDKICPKGYGAVT
jgi:hypothetical protein